MKHEKRTLVSEIRTDGRRLQGYAATFGNSARIGGGFTETIAQGAFTKSLSAQSDILALVDHDPSKVLARTRSGTLQLRQDEKGLAFEFQLPNTQAGSDVLALATRGDLGGMSFGFTVLDDEYTGEHRELKSVELHEISVVLAWPAYDGTIVSARSKKKLSGFAVHANRVVQLLELAR